MRKTLLIASALVLTGLSGTPAAFADEVVIHRDSPDLPPPPSSSTTTVEKHESADGCASKSVHREDDAGNSKTVEKTNCD